MNRIPEYSEVQERIVSWLSDYLNDSGMNCWVIGVSGGIDSAVASTLAARTGKPVYAIGMPINQDSNQEQLSDVHLKWLETNYENVTTLKFDLTDTFNTLAKTMKTHGTDRHALANTRSRLRMVTLYQVAGKYGGLVVGTGNKVEDYGVGFYTKYGDGGVDIAPIADLYKTEVWELGRYLGVDPRIVEAKPTDGLWDDGRTDEDQLGASYADLETAMEFGYGPGLEVLQRFNKMNQHKMQPIPTFTL
jgi:NAD+ synthase